MIISVTDLAAVAIGGGGGGGAGGGGGGGSSGGGGTAAGITSGGLPTATTQETIQFYYGRNYNKHKTIEKIIYQC